MDRLITPLSSGSDPAVSQESSQHNGIADWLAQEDQAAETAKRQAAVFKQQLRLAGSDNGSPEGGESDRSPPDPDAVLESVLAEWPVEPIEANIGTRWGKLRQAAHEEV